MSSLIMVYDHDLAALMDSSLHTLQQQHSATTVVDSTQLLVLRLMHNVVHVHSPLLSYA